MQIGARPESAQFKEGDTFETKTNNWILSRVARAFIPQTTISLQQIRVLIGEAIKTRTTEAVFAFDNETQRNRKFAKRLLISLDRGQPGQQIAFAVCSATRVQLS